VGPQTFADRQFGGPNEQTFTYSFRLRPPSASSIARIGAAANDAHGTVPFMIDHIVLTVQSCEKSKAFYLKALKPLGYGLVKEYPGGAGFGADARPSFWIGEARPGYWTDAHGASRSPTHIALRAPSRAAVRAFHAAALEAGGMDYGAPEIRAKYHPNHYGAFVLDPDGNNLEAVINTPE